MTYCTGIRNGARTSGPTTGTDSRCPSSVGPSYQGVRVDRSTTLSPASADTGIVTTASSAKPSERARPAKSLPIAASTASSWSTRSILLIASTSRGTRSSARTAACRRVCATMPLRASTSSTASSAVDAPVTVLRVYCTCPGVSASTNSRRGVEK